MLTIIIPTLGTRIKELKRLLDSLASQTNSAFNVICIVQDNYAAVESVLEEYSFSIITILAKKKGLSAARNLAMEKIDRNSTCVTFSDDDCWYPSYAVEKVLEFNIDDRQCVCFQIFDPESQQYYKGYPTVSSSNMSKRELLKISSIEIFVPRSIVEENIRFDEDFGLGTSNPSGEENIFLFDLIKRNYIISYMPEIIVFHGVPNWANKEYTFKGKGALFARLYNRPIGLLMVFIYSIRKYKLFTSFFNQFSGMVREVFR